MFMVDENGQPIMADDGAEEYQQQHHQ